MVKCLKSSNATKLLSQEFQAWLQEREITHEKSLAYSLEFNGKAKHVQPVTLSTIYCLLKMLESIPKHKESWEEILLSENYPHNRMYGTSGIMPEKTSMQHA